MKNVTILALGMLLTQLSFAQDNFRFGLKSAANISWIGGTNKTIENASSKVGFAYGIMGDYWFKDNYGLSGELLMSRIDGKINLLSSQNFNNSTDSNSSTGLVYDYKLQYIEIPISLKFRTKEIGNMRYWGNFGFSPGFLINAKASITGDIPQDIKDKDPIDFLVNDNEGDDYATNNFDDKIFLFRFPLIIGGGVEYSLAGKTAIQGGVRFSNSFTDIFVKDKTVVGKNNYVAISLGVLF